MVRAQLAADQVAVAGRDGRKSCDAAQYAAPMPAAFARAVSLLGHPLPVLSLTLAGPSFPGGQG